MKPGAVLHTVETFLLDGDQDPPIRDQRRRPVVAKIDAEVKIPDG